MTTWQEQEPSKQGIWLASTHARPLQQSLSLAHRSLTVLHTCGAVLSFCTQDDTSKSMNTSAFSCGVIAPPAQSCGNTWLAPVPISAVAVTWKSLNTTRPHCVPASPSGSGGGL